MAMVGQVVEHGLAGELAVRLQRQERRADPPSAEQEADVHVSTAVVDRRDAQFGPLTEPEVVNTNGLWASWLGVVLALMLGHAGGGAAVS